MYHKTTTVALAVLLIALVSFSDATNYWRIAKGRNARYTARSPRLYDSLKNTQVKRYGGIDDVEAAENTIDNWLRDWIISNRNFIRGTIFDDTFTNEV